MVSFNFPHHSDHHLNPRRPYYLLQHLSESPKMPMGYFGMFLMALVPPLWFKIMNPRVTEKQVDLSKLSNNLNHIH
jgi:alkane 1-monooxygenase